MTDLVHSPVAAVARVIDPGDPAEQVRASWLLRFKSANTREAYNRDIHRWFDFLTDIDVPVFAARLTHVTVYMRLLEQQTERHVGRNRKLVAADPPSPATVARKVAVISSYYQHARRMELATTNPADGVDRPYVDPDHSDTVGLTADEMRRYLDTARTAAEQARQRYQDAVDQGRRHQRLHDAWMGAERDYTIVALMLCVGGRETEIGRTARIQDLGYDRGVRVLKVTRKGGKRQSLALGGSASVVDRYIMLLAEETGRRAGPLFLTMRGTPPSRPWLFTMVRAIAAAAHIPDPDRITPHSLRHSFATLSFELEVPATHVQLAMGHANMRTTTRYDRGRIRLDRSPSHQVSEALLGGE